MDEYRKEKNIHPNQKHTLRMQDVLLLCVKY